MCKELDKINLNGFHSKYELRKKLGEGHHSQVYLCYSRQDKKRDNPLAVKVSREDDIERKNAHKKEFAITSMLKHPNVSQSIEFFDNPLAGEIHIVMKFVEGVEVLESIVN